MSALANGPFAPGPITTGPLGAAPTGAPARAHWIAAALGSLVVHAVAVGVWLRPEPELDLDADFVAIPIELGPAELPPAGRVEDFEPPPPPPEPEPEPEEPDEPEPDVLAERAEDAPPVERTAPPPPPPPAPAPPRLTSSAGGDATSGFGLYGDLSLAEYQMVALYIDRAGMPFIRALTYPEAARRRGLSGLGKLHVTVNRAGRIVDIGLYESTGHAVLDAELRRVMRQVRRLPPLPDAFPRETLTFGVPVRFEMMAGP